MGTIADKLNLLLNTKAAIKSAIIGKGQTVADSDPFSAYPAKIQAIETGIQLPTLTNPGTAADLLAGKELIDQDGNPLTGSMPSLTAQTITPGVSDQVIAAGRYLAGAVTVSGDSNLIASNIKSGVNIFGVNGNYSGQYKFSYFSGISRYSSTEIRIPVDIDIDSVVGVAIKSNNFIHSDWTYNGGLFSVMWWDDGTEYGDGNRWRLSTTGDAGTGSDNLDIPIKIGGPSSGLYARLIAQGGGKWADGCTYEGFIVYKVYGS